MTEAAASYDASLAPGTMVGAYRIDRRLGAGGVGTVYAAIEPTIKKRVAIKVLRHAFAEDASAVERFKREAQAANDVRHPGIVDVFGIGSLPDGRPYLVMSLLEGRTLRDEIAARGRLPGHEAWSICREVCDALAASHAAGVVHRDLKPDNVFLERIGDRPVQPKILDFGLAKVSDGGDESSGKLTQTGVILGTPAYMAPEQWWGSPTDSRTDQYALGAMLHEMLTGTPPFQAAQAVGLLQKHLHETPPSLAERGATASPEVEELVRRMLAKAGDDRFQSLREVVRSGDIAFGRATSSLQSAPAAPVAVDAPTVASDARAMEADPAVAKRSLRRYLALHAAILVTGLGATLAIGYTGPGARSVRNLFRIAGLGPSIGSFVVFLVAAAVLGWVAKRRIERDRSSSLAWMAAFLVAFSGAVGTYSGWMAIMGGIAEAPPTQRFPIFGMGMYEANANRFIGFSLAMTLFLSLGALAGLSGAPASRAARFGLSRTETLSALSGLAFVAVAALVAGAPSAALVAVVAAGALSVGLFVPAVHPDRAARDELARAAAGLVAVGLAIGVAFARIQAREGFLWLGSESRADRVREILGVASERRATTLIAIACLAVVAAVELLRIRRLRRQGVTLRPAGRTLVLAAVIAATFGADSFLYSRVLAERDSHRSALAAQFSLQGRLEPPTGAHLGKDLRPHKAPSLQVTRDAIVVEGRPVTRLAAAAGAGRDRVFAALNDALARAAVDAPAGGPDLAITVDREVPQADLRSVLRVAYDAGARDVEVLLLRDEPPESPPTGSPEAVWLLPSDFAAIPARLAPTSGSPTGTFGAAARALAAQAMRGDRVTLGVVE